MKIYRAAVVGCGRIGSGFDKTPLQGFAASHAGAYTLCQRTELAAGCDADPKKREEFAAKWPGVRVYADVVAMLKVEEIDILSVCTPPDGHFAAVKAAAGSSVRAIYCEKPIAGSTADARKMLSLCRRKKKLLVINHQRRFTPFYQELKAAIQSGRFGTIQQVTCYYTRGIYNTGTHLVDFFIFLFGQVKDVQAAYSANVSNFPGDPNLDLIIRFTSGVRVVMSACDDARFLIAEVDIVGSRARVRMGKKDVEYFEVLQQENLLNKNELVRQDNPFKSAYGPVSLTAGVEHVIECLETKRRPLSAGEDGAYALKVLEALCRSAKIKKPVVFKRSR